MDTVPSIERQRAFYDDRWSQETYAVHVKLQRCVAILNSLEGLQLTSPKMLDLGCGTGWLTSILGRFGPTTGVDLSPVAIQKAQALYPDVRFMAADLSSETINETYDVIVSHEVIEHLEDQKHYLDLVAQFLNPGGHVILTTPNAWNLEHWKQEDLTGLQPVENWLTRKKLKFLLEPQFRIVRLTTIIVGYGSCGIFRIVNSAKLASILRSLRMLKWYERIQEYVGFGLHLIVVAQRR
jgi:2-polyprenyl-3-methyl-5-hydroxy-6-metoxy-1,4-benzoquinol methylase